MTEWVDGVRDPEGRSVIRCVKCLKEAPVCCDAGVEPGSEPGSTRHRGPLCAGCCTNHGQPKATASPEALRILGLEEAVKVAVRAWCDSYGAVGEKLTSVTNYLKSRLREELEELDRESPLAFEPPAFTFIEGGGTEGHDCESKDWACGPAED